MSESWFALQVYHGREKAVSTWLTASNLQCLLLTYEDKRQWSDRQQVIQVPLFPGYLFCCFDYAVRSSVLAVPGVHKIVQFGASPTPVDPDEMRELLRLNSSPLPLQPWPYLRGGDLVSIARGPVEGLRGKVVEIKNKARVVVNVTILGRAVAVEIDQSWARPERPQSSGREPLVAAARGGGARV